jgi:hypothetical protein
MQVQDAKVDSDVLDDLVPLHGRWPDPRVLTEQGERFWLRDGEELVVADLDPPEVEWLLGWLTSLAPVLHDRAARDELLTTSTGVRRSLKAAGVLLVAETPPLVWLESTELVRALRARADPLR